MWEALGQAAFYFGVGSLLLGMRKTLVASTEASSNAVWKAIGWKMKESRYGYYLANFIILATASVAFFFGLVTLYALITGQPSPIR